jgi:hypothetical protein
VWWLEQTNRTTQERESPFIALTPETDDDGFLTCHVNGHLLREPWKKGRSPRWYFFVSETLHNRSYKISLYNIFFYNDAYNKLSKNKIYSFLLIMSFKQDFLSRMLDTMT